MVRDQKQKQTQQKFCRFPLKGDAKQKNKNKKERKVINVLKEDTKERGGGAPITSEYPREMYRWFLLQAARYGVFSAKGSESIGPRH